MEISKTDDAYASADKDLRIINWIAPLAYHFKQKADYDMEQNPEPPGKKRDAHYMHAQELQWKLKSKADFLAYLDQHRKYPALSCLTPP